MKFTGRQSIPLAGPPPSCYGNGDSTPNVNPSAG